MFTACVCTAKTISLSLVLLRTKEVGVVVMNCCGKVNCGAVAVKVMGSLSSELTKE